MIDVDAPSLPEVIEQIFDAQLAELKVAIPAEGSDFDKDSKTITVEAWIVDTPEIPIIEKVPVCFPGLVWDIEDGTSGILIAGDKRWIASWRVGSRQIPEDEGTHEYDYAIFIPGMRKKAESEAFTVGSGDTICPQLSSGDLLLGDSTATEYLLLGTTFNSDLSTFLTGMNTGMTALTSAATFPQVNAAATTMLNAITAFQGTLANHLSTDVKTK